MYLRWEPMSISFLLAGWLWALYLDWQFALALALIIFGYEVRNFLEAKETHRRLLSLEHPAPRGD